MKKLLHNTIFYLVVALLLLLESTAMYGQQIPQFTNYTNHQLLFNPAYVNNNYGIHVDGVARIQWLGIEGQPFTQGVNIHTSSPLLRSSFGVSILNDLIGAERNTSVYVNYAYMQPIGDNLLTIGIRGGGIQKALDGSKLRTPEGIYEGGVFIHEDDLLPTNAASSVTPDIGIGVFFQTKQLAIGLAIQQLLNPTATWTIGEQSSEIIYTRHVTLNSSYQVDLGSYWMLQPAFLLKSDFNKYQVDISTTLTYNDYLKVGTSWRGVGNDNFGAIAVLVGIPINKNLQLNYSYDFITSALRNPSSGSHEISFQYTFKKIGQPKPTKTIHSPRFL